MIKAGTVLSICLLFSASLSGQDKMNNNQFNLGIYPEVMDLVFPRNEFRLQNISTKQTITEILIVRISPSFENEYQVNLRRFGNGKVEGLIFKLNNINNGIWDKLSSLSAKKELDKPEVIAKQFSVRKVEISTSARLETLLKELEQLQIAPMVESDIVLDSTKYEFWCETMSGKIYVQTFLGRNTKNKKLIKWIKEMETIVKLKTL
jgi:hypothetical protein